MAIGHGGKVAGAWIWPYSISTEVKNE